MAPKRAPRVRQREQVEVARALEDIVDRLAMSRAVLIIRGDDGAEYPIGAIVSMANLMKLEAPGSQALSDARAALEEAKLAAGDQKPAAASHLCVAVEKLLTALGG